MSKNGYVLNNALSLFSYGDKDSFNGPRSKKQPRGLMAPILSFNKKNPCVRRFSISYSHKGGSMDDDLALSGIFFHKILLLNVKANFMIYNKK